MQKAMSTKMSLLISVGFVAAVIFGLISSGRAASDKESVPFNADTRYDVYFYGGEERLRLVKNVKVLEITSIQGLPFLVVYTTDFKPDKGYIQLSEIVAILPVGQAVESK
jgi:hypothetical protein